MSSPNVFESPVFEQPRLSYRKAVVDLFRDSTEPVIRKAVEDITAWQVEVNTLKGEMDLRAAKIADAQRYIGELQQAVQGIEERADLPLVPFLPQGQGDAQRHAEAFGGPQTGVLMNPCGCGLPMEFDEKRGGLIHRDEHGWEAAGESCRRVKDASKALPPTGDGVS